MGAVQTAGSQDNDLRLSDYVAILRRRWLIIVVFVVVGVMAAALFSARTTDMYRSTARVLVRNADSSVIFDSRNQPSVQVFERQLENEIEFAQSDIVRSQATETFGESYLVTVDAESEADILSITATDRDPQAAAEKANIYAATYVAKKAENAVGSFDDTIAVIDARLNAIDLEQVEIINRGDDDAIVLRALEDEESRLLEQKAELELRTDIASSNAQITRDARAAGQPFEPNWQTNLILGAAGGLVVGLAAAFAREGMDDRIQSRRDLEQALPSVPLLGALPPPETELGVHVAHARSGLFLESARAMRSSLQFIIGDAGVRSVAITSPNASEGKSTTAVTLAFLAARTGQRVLLIDADLRRPKLAEGLGLDPSETGLREFLSYGDTVVLQEAWVAGEEPVAFLGPGTDGTAVSADLFVAERWSSLVQEMEEKFDLVIVDTSPALPVTDGVLAAAGCGMTVLVARRDATTAAQLATAMTSLERARCVVAGTVLSDARTERSYGYSGGYYRP